MADRRFGAGLLAEFVVIVLGVLAALAVDEWRDSRIDRELEVELLNAFVCDLSTDSADFARLPERAEGRVAGAELVLRAFTAGSRPADALSALLDSMEADGRIAPGPLSDGTLEEALTRMSTTSDLDVATGAYRDFTEGGSYRLLTDHDLRTRIHEYYYSVDQNLEYNQIAGDAVSEVTRRGHDLGVAAGMGGAEIREHLQAGASPARDSYFAALHSLQRRSATQRRIAAVVLAGRAEALLAEIRAELARLQGS
jgi:hypothetical protein